MNWYSKISVAGGETSPNNTQIEMGNADSIEVGLTRPGLGRVPVTKNHPKKRKRKRRPQKTKSTYPTLYWNQESKKPSGAAYGPGQEPGNGYGV
jgi:hypothetical protein